MEICRSKSTAKRPPQNNTKNEGAEEPTYRGTEFHRIIPHFMVQGGDFTNFDGSGGYAHPSTNSARRTFNDETFLSHSSEGILSMANRGKNTNGSQFFITLGKCLHLDGKHVAFGKVVKGMEVVRDIGGVETEGERPVRLQRVVIVDCGEGWGDEEDDDGSLSSQSLSDQRKRKKRKYKRKKREEKEKKSKHSKHHKRYKREYDSSDDSRERTKKRRKREKSSKHRRRSRDDRSDSSASSR
jgi:cyclophilin family peptidyl-prolyl cis-trans isomerase